MELRQLRYFVRVVELGSFSQAAASLGVVTSALSQQVSKLEGELSTRGESYVNTLRDDARKLAPSLGLVKELEELDALIGALLGTRQARLRTGVGSARAAGKPYDPKRLELFAQRDELPRLKGELRHALHRV